MRCFYSTFPPWQGFHLPYGGVKMVILLKDNKWMNLNGIMVTDKVYNGLLEKKKELLSKMPLENDSFLGLNDVIEILLERC